MTFQETSVIVFLKINFSHISATHILVHTELMKRCVWSQMHLLLMRTYKTHSKGKRFFKQLAIPTHNCGWRKTGRYCFKTPSVRCTNPVSSTASSACPAQKTHTNQPAGGSLCLVFLIWDLLLKVGKGQSRPVPENNRNTPCPWQACTKLLCSQAEPSLATITETLWAPK